MPMIDRIKAICLKPNAEWPVIEAETTSTRDLMIGYVVPLAAIAPHRQLRRGRVHRTHASPSWGPTTCRW